MLFSNVRTYITEKLKSRIHCGIDSGIHRAISALVKKRQVIISVAIVVLKAVTVVPAFFTIEIPALV